MATVLATEGTVTSGRWLVGKSEFRTQGDDRVVQLLPVAAHRNAPNPPLNGRR